MSDSTFGDLFAFSRTSTAWRTNAAGQSEQVPADVPRFDYDPATKAPRGLLIEPAGSNPDNSARAPDHTKVTLNLDWFNPTRGVWVVQFEYPGAGQCTVLEVNASGVVFGLEVVDGNVFAYFGTDRYALDTAMGGVITQIVLAYGPNGVRAARNGVVVELSAARVQRVTDVRLGETSAAAQQLDSRMVSVGYVGRAASVAEIAAYATSDEWADISDYIAQSFGDGFVPLSAALDTAINT
ncbi:hypothetical protein PQR72_34580 [Paraburkholderia madseniana]|uniref:hypothetical protein n=1 Tax=Paraburkholderia madseniana TaxID=2599607 RepID=UPI0015C538E8|nr:hypothetical protein [Paraburkholderia madseniana]NPT63592.1 hypothetical protein [Paraburkholderia madseniana]